MAEVESLEKNWYVVNTYASHENKVKDNILRRVESFNMEDLIFRVIVAEYEEPVMKVDEVTGVSSFSGKFKTKNMYPGYVFIEMIMTDEAWYVVRNTPGVTGFIGSSGKGAKPFPVGEVEMEAVLKRVGLGEEDSTKKYKVGDRILIMNGPYANQEHVIASIDEEKGLVTFTTIVFSRMQNIEISINDIQKL